jgi:hypothetical protein
MRHRRGRETAPPWQLRQPRQIDAWEPAFRSPSLLLSSPFPRGPACFAPSSRNSFAASSPIPDVPLVIRAILLRASWSVSSSQDGNVNRVARYVHLRYAVRKWLANRPRTVSLPQNLFYVVSAAYVLQSIGGCLPTALSTIVRSLLLFEYPRVAECGQHGSLCDSTGREKRDCDGLRLFDHLNPAGRPL